MCIKSYNLLCTCCLFDILLIVIAGLQKGCDLWTALKEGQFEHGDKYIKLKGNNMWLLEDESVLFEYKCNQDLFEKIYSLKKPGKKYCRVVVTGNPGIGKSWFFIYCLFCFLQHKEMQ